MVLANMFTSYSWMGSKLTYMMKSGYLYADLGGIGISQSSPKSGHRNVDSAF